MKNRSKAYFKIIKCINSSTTLPHLQGCQRMIEFFDRQFPNSLVELSQLVSLIKSKPEYLKTIL